MQLGEIRNKHPNSSTIINIQENVKPTLLTATSIELKDAYQIEKQRLTSRIKKS